MSAFNRRQLLTSGTTALTFSALLASQTEGEQTGLTPFLVRSGEARRGGPWLIRGEKAFSTKVSGADIGNKYTAIEVHTPPGHGPELHVHLRQNELFFMLGGSIGLQCGSDRTILNAGDTLMAPANIPHAFVVLGKDSAHILMIFDPAGSMESYFAEYASAVNANADTKKLAEIAAKHEIKVVGPPLEASSFA